jgi:hypothetical protein
MKAPCIELLKRCKDSGYEMRPYFTLRDPFKQAEFWRQSRSIEEIEEKISEFKDAEAMFLAYCIESVGPQFGDHVTNAPPGYSWHQWGEAMDCFWLVEGKAIWSDQKKINGVNGYRNYAKIAIEIGLTSGGLWKSIKDWPHVQLRENSSPGYELSPKEISKEMEIRFSNLMT